MHFSRKLIFFACVMCLINLAIIIPVYADVPTVTYVTQWGSSPTSPGFFKDPYGIAEDESGNVYVADTDNNRIQKFTSDGTFILQWGSSGSENGQFNGPEGIAIDHDDNVYITDWGNNRIQKFTSTGSYLTQWGSTGTGNGQFQNPWGIATDISGNVYVFDNQINRIQKFSSAGTYLTQWGSTGTGNGQFQNPRGIAIDSSSNVYVSDSQNNRVQKFSSTGSYITQWGSQGYGDGQFSYPEGITVDNNGNLYVADWGFHRIQKFASDGTFLTKWGTYGNGNGQFVSPRDVVADSSGNVYVADTDNNRIQKFTSTGVFVRKWGDTTAAGQFTNPSGVVADRSGSVFVVDTSNYRIQKFTSDGTYITLWGSYGTGNGQFHYPRRAAVDSVGNVYVVDWWGTNPLQKFSSTGTFVTKWGSTGTGNGQFGNLNGIQGIAIDSKDNVYVTDFDNNRVQKFSSSGTYLTQWGSKGSGNGQFDGPWGIAVDGSDNVYVADNSNNRVQKFTAEGTYITQWGVWGTGDGQLWGPTGITGDDLGNVFVIDSGNNRVQVFSSSGTYLTQWDSSGTDITSDNFGNIYIITDSQVKKFSITNNPLPVASFSATQTSGALTVAFTDTSTNSPTSWEWDFQNDGTPDSTIQNPTFTYSSAGTYTVKLTATNTGGSSVPFFQVIEVREPTTVPGSSTVPPEIIDSPFETGGAPVIGEWWNIEGSPDHIVGGGIGGSDDTNAYDLNKGSVSDDEGEPVYAVENGFIPDSFGVYKGSKVGPVGGSYGVVLIQHGSAGHEWYSAYVHMKNIPARLQKGAMVSKGEHIGDVSHTAPIVIHPHLHFAVYTGNPDLAGGLVSKKVIIKDIAQSSHLCPPTLLSPGSRTILGSSGIGLQPTFTWCRVKPVGGTWPTKYNLAIRNLRTEAIITRQIAGSSNTYTLDVPLDPGTQYRWNMQSCVGTTCSNWNDEQDLVAPRLYFTTISSIIPSNDGDGSTAVNSAAAQNAPLSSTSTTTSVNVGGNSAVSQVSITGTGTKEAIVTAFLQQSLPESTPSLNTPVYEYIAITPARVTTVSSAEISFTVPQSWLTEHQVTLGTVFDPCPIVLERYHDGQWTSLPTQYTGNVYGTPTFTAQSPGFSTFAITINPNITATAPAMQKGGNLTQVTLSAPTQSISEVTQIQTRLSETNVSALPEVTKTETAVNPIFLLGIGCVGFIGLIGGSLLIRRWWIRRQNPALFKEYK